MMLGHRHNGSDKFRQDAELRAMGLPAAKMDRWGEVGMVVLVVAMLGTGIAIALDLSGFAFKAVGFVSIAIGGVLGLILRAKLLARDKKRLTDQKIRVAIAKEAELQKQLAAMRAKESKNN